jgi:hypothetical protein
MILLVAVTAVMAVMMVTVAGGPAFARSATGTDNVAFGFGQGSGGGAFVNAGEGQGDPASNSLPPGKLKKT